MDRRDFLLRSLAAGALCGALAGCGGARYVTAERLGSRLVVRKAAFGERDFVLLENPQLPRAIFVHRVGPDAYTALLTRCTHRGCQAEPAGDRLACPCHGSEYAFDGSVLQGPAERALYRYRITTDAEHVYIELPDPATL
ncbi:MAG: Rieske (2Fe-2S) protein [Rhodothermales bacterium]|nr:Rieske (2Fe-2S) protein [Rhodothermales bacterium]